MQRQVGNTPMGKNPILANPQATVQVVVGNIRLGDNPVPQSNTNMILVSATGCMFSIEAATQYLTMTAAQKDQLTVWSRSEGRRRH